MNIAIVGSGYVGLVTGASLADRGNHITLTDKNEQLINRLSKGEVHIFEPGLEELVKKNLANNNLSFTTDTPRAASHADITFLTANTPPREDGSFNLDHLQEAARQAGKGIRRTTTFKVIATKSTVPQGSHTFLTDIIREEAQDADWAYAANPETLAASYLFSANAALWRKISLAFASFGS